VVLGGPWQFKAGDEPSWSDPALDDSKWERIDLSAAADAHDSDVGLTGYTRGWAARGHPGYSGYAWYRMHLKVSMPVPQPLAIAGPAAVDDAYQLFVNGRLLGGGGVFSGNVPSARSMQPRYFPLSMTDLRGEEGPLVIAVRVWMDARSLADPEGGGIHIVPAIGTADAVRGHVRLQWDQTIRGYAVDLVEPVLFAFLAALALTLRVLHRGHHGYTWMVAALALTAAVRFNQIVYAWGQIETTFAYNTLRYALLEPLGLGAWVMAWAEWFALRPGVRSRRVIILLMIIAAALSLIQNSLVFAGASVAWHAALETTMHAVKLGFLGLLAWLTIRGWRGGDAWEWVSVCAIVLLATGLFAAELSAIGVPGIWFPFGTGVSRTQYAYAALIVVLYLLLQHRFPGAADASRS